MNSGDMHKRAKGVGWRIDEYFPTPDDDQPLYKIWQLCEDIAGEANLDMSLL